jgi:hypothetical protein
MRSKPWLTWMAIAISMIGLMVAALVAAFCCQVKLRGGAKRFCALHVGKTPTKITAY